MCILCEYRLSAKCVFAQAEAGGMSYSSSFSDAGQHPTTEKVLKYMQTRAWYINPRSAAFAVWVVGTGACTESMTADRIVTFEFDKMCPQRNVHVQIAVQIAVERRTSFL